MRGRKGKRLKLSDVHVYLFTEDVKLVESLAAEKGIPFSIELRSLVRQALRGYRREIAIIKE